MEISVFINESQVSFVPLFIDLNSLRREEHLNITSFSMEKNLFLKSQRLISIFSQA